MAAVAPLRKVINTVVAKIDAIPAPSVEVSHPAPLMSASTVSAIASAVPEPIKPVKAVRRNAKKEATMASVVAAPISTPVSTPPVAVVAAPAPVVASVDSSVTTDVATVAAALSAETSALVAESKTQQSCSELHEDAIMHLKNAMDSLRGVVRLIREADKSHNRNMREATGNRRRPATPTPGTEGEPVAKRQPAGFTKACRISDDLADFLKSEVGSVAIPSAIESAHQAEIQSILTDCQSISRGCVITRQKVTQLLRAYFECKGLHSTENGRFINYSADPRLCNLFRLEGKQAGKPLTYFNLQSAIKHHFIKETPAASVTSAPSTTSSSAPVS